jgi:hypothetical protein
MTKTTTYALTTTEAAALASKVAAGASLTKKQIAAVTLTVLTNDSLPVDVADILLDAVEAAA